MEGGNEIDAVITTVTTLTYPLSPPMYLSNLIVEVDDVTKESSRSCYPQRVIRTVFCLRSWDSPWQEYIYIFNAGSDPNLSPFETSPRAMSVRVASRWNRECFPPGSILWYGRWTLRSWRCRAGRSRELWWMPWVMLLRQVILVPPIGVRPEA